MYIYIIKANKMNKEQFTPEYDYNNPIKVEEFNIVNFSDDGHEKRIGFIYNNKYFRFIYKYGKQFGFSFIKQYANKNNFENELSTLGGTLIYSSTMEKDCTDFGKYLEYSFMKAKFTTNYPQLIATK